MTELARRITKLEDRIKGFILKLDTAEARIKSIRSSIANINDAMDPPIEVLTWDEFKQEIYSINETDLVYNTSYALYNCDNTPNSSISFQQAVETANINMLCHPFNNNLSYAFAGIAVSDTSRITDLTLSISLTTSRANLKAIFSNNPTLVKLAVTLVLVSNVTFTDLTEFASNNPNLEEFTLKILKLGNLLQINEKCSKLCCDCPSLKTCDINALFTDANNAGQLITYASDLSDAFRNTSITELDLSGEPDTETNSNTNTETEPENTITNYTWGTASKEFVNISNMFRGNPKIRSINCANWHTENVKDFSGIFADTPNLVQLDITGWMLDKNSSWLDMFKNTGSGVMNTPDAFTLIASLHIIILALMGDQQSYIDIEHTTTESAGYNLVANIIRAKLPSADVVAASEGEEIPQSVKLAKLIDSKLALQAASSTSVSGIVEDILEEIIRYILEGVFDEVIKELLRIGIKCTCTVKPYSNLGTTTKIVITSVELVEQVTNS